MNTSPERRGGDERRSGYGRRGTDSVLRGADAHALATARFDVDLHLGGGIPEVLVADARAAAHATGYAAGWSQGHRDAQRAMQADRERVVAETRAVALAHDADLARAFVAIAAAASQLEARAVPVADEVSDLILRTAFTVAETVLDRELAVSTEPGHDALRRALALTPERRPVTVRMHPTDHATLTAVDGAAPDSAANGAVRRELDGRTVTLLPDPTLRPGDAMVTCDATTVDARISAALDRIREVLAS